MYTLLTQLSLWPGGLEVATAKTDNFDVHCLIVGATFGIMIAIMACCLTMSDTCVIIEGLGREWRRGQVYLGLYSFY